MESGEIIVDLAVVGLGLGVWGLGKGWVICGFGGLVKMEGRLTTPPLPLTLKIMVDLRLDIPFWFLVFGVFVVQR